MKSKNNKKYLITSALPYINGDLHMGHFVGCLAPSDVYARFCRALGRDVLYICGSDDHGTPAMVAAAKEGISVADYTARYYERQLATVKKFGFSFDLYGRTHTPFQEKLVQDLFARLNEQGFVEERETAQPFSVDDNKFLADRQIEGTCPKCGYERARGDQCTKCDELLDPADLINPYVADTGSTNIEMRKTKNLFFLAHKVKGDVSKWLRDTMEKNGWPRSAIGMTRKYLSEDMPDPSITRDLSWGIPVPGYPGKVFYVWFDAPWGYVSISQAATPRWAEFWHGGDNCKYVQFMGKDNIKFHSILFPGQEIALDENWKKVDLLKGMNFLNFNSGKVSKSTGGAITIDEMLGDAPADAWRYALMASAPETDDTDFTIQRFADVVNKDLNGMLGNFVSRVCKLTEKSFGNKVPPFCKDFGDGISNFENLKNTVNAKLAELTAALEACEFRKSVAALREIWAAGNEFMTIMGPWTLIKNGDLERAGAVLDECFQLIDLYARLSAPFIPDAAESMQHIFKTKHDLSWPAEYEWRIADGEEFMVPENLFTRIDDDKIAEMTEKYIKKAPNIVIAKILTVEPHPDSDHMHVLTVDEGDGVPVTIVCGAPNVRVGLVGVWAKPGAKLPGVAAPLTARKVRGIMSNGMMCAADELGITFAGVTGPVTDLIVELPADSVIGNEFKGV
ncbi:MAG: methionine--tRNA ligase [Proteobacteria bacterium]|nr:methionine--tRNA ligase [Pseudomonadota bacterium]